MLHNLEVQDRPQGMKLTNLKETNCFCLLLIMTQRTYLNIRNKTYLIP